MNTYIIKMIVKKILFLLIIIFCLNTYASSRAVVVMDTESKRVLYSENMNEEKLIASTTKIMTFVVAYEYAQDFLDVKVEAGDEILKMYGTSIYLSLHEKMTLRDLLYGLMLRSGNDAAVVIANFVGGSIDGFVKLMNKKAQFLGMNNTKFYNPHGLDEETKNISTAYDMALLSSYATRIPLYNKVTSTKYYKVQTENKAYSWTNRNKFLFMYPLFINGKTGYTPTAGRCLVTTAKNNNLQLTVVSLNDYNHYENQRLLYDEMFKKYQKTLIISKNFFNVESDNLYIKQDIYYPLKESEKEKINIKLLLNDVEKAKKGELIVELDGKMIVKEDVYGKIRNDDYHSKSFLEKIKELLKKIL